MYVHQMRPDAITRTNVSGVSGQGGAGGQASCGLDSRSCFIFFL
jgi:hypothetical protein